MIHIGLVDVDLVFIGGALQGGTGCLFAIGEETPSPPRAANTVNATATAAASMPSSSMPPYSALLALDGPYSGLNTL